MSRSSPELDAVVLALASGFVIGLGFVAMLRVDIWLWPSVLLGIFAAELAFGRSLGDAALGAVSLLLAPLFALGLRRITPEPLARAESPLIVLRLVALALAALLPAASLVFASPAPPEAAEILPRLLSVWASLALGAVLLASPLLACSAATWHRLGRSHELLRAIAIWIAVGVLSGLACFIEPLRPLLFVVLLAQAWLSAREDRFVAGCATIVAGCVVAAAAASGERLELVAASTDASLLSFLATLIGLQLMVSALAGKQLVEHHALEQSRLQNRDLMEAAGDAVFLIDGDGVVFDANENACASLGRPIETLVGLPVSDFDVEMDQARVIELVSQIRDEGAPPFETTHRHADGHSFPVEVRVSPVRSDGAPGVIAVVRDLTERRRAQAALIENEARLRAIVDNEPECVKVLDADCRLLDMNPAGIKMIAAESIDQVRGWNTLDLLAPDFREGFAEGVAEVFRGNKTFQVFEIIALDGTRRWMEQHAVPLRDPNDPSKVKEMLAVTRDITERKRNELEMLHKQRLEALGTLAGGIAHDLNNLLAPIMLSLEELNSLRGSNTELVSTLEASTQRASDMVKQLLSFARGFEGERRTIQVEDLIAELRGIVQATFPKNMVLDFDTSPDVGAILGDPTQLHQVLLNICVNARDAMPEGGVLGVRTTKRRVLCRVEGDALRPVDPDRAGANVEQRDFVVIAIRDTGCGIPEDTQSRIFEPFYTTKGPDKGTGLGLSSALGIVESHGGFIRLESKLGRGSRFEICLPMQAVDAATVGGNGAVCAVSGEGRTALVVDDEDAVRYVTERALKRMGFEVVPVGSGEEGLEALRERGAEFSIVISDLRMPGMDGLEFLRAARQALPDVALVLTTGRMDEASMAEGDQIEGLIRLAKPYTIKELQRTLQEAFAQAL